MGVALIGAIASVVVGILAFRGSIVVSRRTEDRVNPRMAKLEERYEETLTRAFNAEARAFSAETRAAAAEDRATAAETATVEARLREQLCQERMGNLEDQVTELRGQLKRLNKGQVP